MKQFFIVALLCMSGSFVNAQVNHELPDDHLTCKHNHQFEQYCKAHGYTVDNHPAVVEYEKYTQEFVKNFGQQRKRGTVYVIPVVFHIVHLGGVENISDAQIHDQMAILNRDFRKLNEDTSDIVGPFKGIAADVEFEFRLAQRDALGNCVSGITRTYSTTTNDGDNGTVDAVNMNLNGSTSTSAIRYPRHMYLNVWVVSNAGGAAGYTNIPAWASFTPKYDGIWILHSYVGSIGTGIPQRSRALTHEIGHWFNLAHTWGNSNNPGCDGTMLGPPCSGDDNCDVDDGVTDTPETIGWTTCNLSGASCGSAIDNVQNYMEYAYCSRMFTEGQKARMHAAVTSTIAGRNNLWSSANLAATGVDGSPNLCAAAFNADASLICAGDSIQFSDMSYHGVTNWNWTFPGGTPATSTAQHPTVTYNTPGQYTVTLDVTDGITNQTLTKTNYITVLKTHGDWTPVYEDFEWMSPVPNGDWYISNVDGMQQWEIFTGAGSSGNKCLKLDNFTFNNENGKDAFISRTFDVSTTSAFVDTVTLHFKYAYRQRTSADVEMLRIWVSSNCGTSWSLRKQLAGSAMSGSMVQTTAFTPLPADWVQVDVTNILSSSFSDEFMFKIEFISDKGNNIYLDDINLAVSVGVPDKETPGISFNVYPNPVSQSATINYSLVSAQNVTLTITDVLGKQVMSSELGTKTAGNHQTQLESSQLPAKGVYFVTLGNGIHKQTQRIVVQ